MTARALLLAKSSPSLTFPLHTARNRAPVRVPSPSSSFSMLSKPKLCHSVASWEPGNEANYSKEYTNFFKLPCCSTHTQAFLGPHLIRETRGRVIWKRGWYIMCLFLQPGTVITAIKVDINNCMTLTSFPQLVRADFIDNCVELWYYILNVWLFSTARLWDDNILFHELIPQSSFLHSIANMRNGNPTIL